MTNSAELLPELRKATRVNMPAREPGMRVVGFKVPEAIVWPDGGAAHDILQILLDAVTRAESRPSLQGDVVERVKHLSDLLIDELAHQRIVLDEHSPAIDTMAIARAALDACGGGWRPIAEAPKDGRYVLIATPRHDGDMLVAMFDQSWGDDGWWLTDDGKNPEIPLRGPAPTHWMPLPPPPSEQEEG